MHDSDNALATCSAAMAPAVAQWQRPAAVSRHAAVPVEGFHVGAREIGPGYPAYLVAEAGVNHDGDVEVAFALVEAAAKAGADAVKFQVFSADRLVTATAPAAGYQRRAVHVATQHEMLARLELPHEQFIDLAAWAEECEIEFLATPFSVPDLEFLTSIGVRGLKLASPDVINGPLLDAAAATGLPVMLSTGAADMSEIAAAVDRFCCLESGPLALLHCISTYPAGESEANLAAIRTLTRGFDCTGGFSDHTPSLTIGGLAAAAGACIIEKHLTLDHARSGPDHGFSLEPAQFAEYVRHIREAEVLLGNGRIEVTPSQREVRRVSRSSVVAARPIRRGQRITPDFLTVKRPGGGISPMHLDRLPGRTALFDIPADAQLTWEALS